MNQTVFVKVSGFSDTERHALNTVFRLSGQRHTPYMLWGAGAPQAPQLALVDGESYEAQLELAAPQSADMKLFWVGPGAPPDAVHTFDRPLVWPQVVQAMDELFASREPLDVDLDLDLERDTGAEDTRPPEPQAPVKRALIVAADRDERLYLRARLSLADLTQADEAASAAEAAELMRDTSYAVALIEFSLTGTDGWAFMKQLAHGQPAIAHVIVFKAGASVAQRLRAWWSGTVLFDKPPEPARLEAVLQKV